MIMIKAVVRFVLFCLTAFGSEIFSKQWNWNLLENEKSVRFFSFYSSCENIEL